MSNISNRWKTYTNANSVQMPLSHTCHNSRHQNASSSSQSSPHANSNFCNIYFPRRLATILSPIPKYGRIWICLPCKLQWALAGCCLITHVLKSNGNTTGNAQKGRDNWKKAWSANASSYVLIIKRLIMKRKPCVVHLNLLSMKQPEKLNNVPGVDAAPGVCRF